MVAPQVGRDQARRRASLLMLLGASLRRSQRQRRQGMAGCLLNAMDADMRQQGMQTAFSIARSLSAGMNITFAKNGYRYGGTLDNNTHIAGRIESMNIWYKHL